MVRARIVHEPDFLCATEAELIGEDEATYDRTLFPDQVSLGRTVLPLQYAYAARRGAGRRDGARAAADGGAAHARGSSSG